MMNRHYHVRDILAMPKNEVWALPDGGLFLTFDNGEELKVPTRSTIESSYYWKLFKYWPGAQILPRHHFQDKFYKADSHDKMSTLVLQDVFFGHHTEYLMGEGNETIWEMARKIYEITNELYNDSICMIGQHVVGLDIEDIVDILNHPGVIKAKTDYEHGRIDVEEAHNTVFSIVADTEGDLKGNVVSNGMASDNLNRRQATQVIGPRAYVPDINGESCKTPIYVGYADGLHTLYDRFRESRAAAISLYMASGPLEQSEYNNRMCQFLCGVITGVYYGDCGGSVTLPWKVAPDDLKYLQGKVHMVEGKQKVIFGHETDLIGKTINLRSITTCTHHDPSKPCSVCLGLNALTVPPGTNLGHHLSTEPLARISQTILSTKHVLASTKSVYLEINEGNARYLRLDPNDNFKVLFTKDVVEGNISLRIPLEQAAFVNDILAEVDIDELSPERISALETIQFIEYDKHGGIRSTMDVSVDIGGKGSPLTLAFLSYMRDVKWDYVGQSLEVKLNEWDYTQPFIKTPRRGEDIMSILKITTQFLHSPNDSGSVRAVDFTKPGPALRGLLDGMSSKIHVNLTHVEVFVRALMALGEDSYALPKGGEPFRFIRLKEAIQKRGLGAALAFEGVSDLIKDPSTYMRHMDDIPSHPLEHLVM